MTAKRGAGGAPAGAAVPRLPGEKWRAGGGEPPCPWEQRQSLSQTTSGPLVTVKDTTACALLLWALFFTALIKIISFTIVLNAASLFLQIAPPTPLTAFYSKTHPCKAALVEKPWAWPAPRHRGGVSALDPVGHPRLGFPPSPQKLAFCPCCKAGCPRAPAPPLPPPLQAPRAQLCSVPVHQRGPFLLTSV